MKKKIWKIIKSKRGAMGVPLIVFTLLAVIIFLFGLDLLNAALQYQNVSYSAKSITKIIECDGAVTDRAEKQMEALNESFNMDMEFTVTDVTYFDGKKKSIQFRDSFVVTVTAYSDIQICSPIFSDPVVYHIPLKATIPGMSEVYWK